MTKVIFGLIGPKVGTETLKEKLGSHESYIKEMQKEKWKTVPEKYREGLQSAYYLHTHHYREREGEVSLLAEWDSVESYKFRGKELWSARTYTGTLRLKHHSNPWMMAIEGEWDVAPRISRILFEKSGQISRMNIPFSVLQDIIDSDSKVEYRGKWKGVETGLDVSLEGSLPKTTGMRSDFDHKGERCSAKFESGEFGRVLSINCEKGYISSNSVPAEEMIRYFEERIAPKLQRK